MLFESSALSLICVWASVFTTFTHHFLIMLALLRLCNGSNAFYSDCPVRSVTSGLEKGILRHEALQGLIPPPALLPVQ